MDCPGIPPEISQWVLFHYALLWGIPHVVFPDCLLDIPLERPTGILAEVPSAVPPEFILGNSPEIPQGTPPWVFLELNTSMDF